MNGQNQRNQLDINMVMDEYQMRVSELTKEVVLLKAYTRQLEGKLAESNKQEQEKSESNNS